MPEAARPTTTASSDKQDEVARLRAALTRIASIYACPDPCTSPCGHMGLADDIAVQALLGREPPEHEAELEPAHHATPQAQP